MLINNYLLLFTAVIYKSGKCTKFFHTNYAQKSAVCRLQKQKLLPLAITALILHSQFSIFICIAFQAHSPLVSRLSFLASHLLPTAYCLLLTAYCLPLLASRLSILNFLYFCALFFKTKNL